MWIITTHDSLQGPPFCRLAPSKMHCKFRPQPAGVPYRRLDLLGQPRSSNHFALTQAPLPRRRWLGHWSPVPHSPVGHSRAREIEETGAGKPGSPDATSHRLLATPHSAVSRSASDSNQHTVADCVPRARSFASPHCQGTFEFVVTIARFALQASQLAALAIRERDSHNLR